MNTELESETVLTDTFRVRIAKAEHVFSAAHFITIGGVCERLHGHNYRVAAEFQGTLDDNRLVIDFLVVRAKLREIVATLDHYVLLPTQHPHMRVADDGCQVTASFGEARWVFPSGDCRLLPVANTTAELLAEYIGHQLLQALQADAGKLQQIRIDLDECDGQIAIWQHNI